MSIAPNFSIVTLGVANVSRSAEFYRALGWEQVRSESDGITWFRTSGTWLGLYGYDLLAQDAAVEPVAQSALPAYRGITLAINLPTEADVDAAFEVAAAAGAPIIKAAHRAEWGGYSGYFADPDGNLWELCFNPGFPIDAAGRIDIPKG
jgi:catechol 2,3-dioxygenase-like lactoylglutathione lyase family enzyme